jgi:hypothetical protein
MRRLFSTFVRGWPGAGLLLMRLVAGAALVIDAVNSVLLEPPLGSTIQHVVAAGAGVLLFLGFWTPIAGALVSVLGTLGRLLAIWGSLDPCPAGDARRGPGSARSRCLVRRCTFFLAGSASTSVTTGTKPQEYAHERGVIHRDLKPANVKITGEDTAKVLDFGLAKALDPQESASSLNLANSPTVGIAPTQAGMILGTAAYMSPEQAKGRPVDRRADIWAFGCVL